jgi:hypothetical protein
MQEKYILEIYFNYSPNYLIRMFIDQATENLFEFNNLEEIDIDL